MKVLLLNGSPKPDGCTKRALKEVEKVLIEEGIETEIIDIGNKNVRGCIACASCVKNGKCVFDDLVNEVAPKFVEADGVVIGTPVYYAHANGGIISFLDRLFFSSTILRRKKGGMKVGATVVSSRRAGSTSAFDEINKYFTISSMPIVSSSYWNEVHGSNKEDVEKDLEGLQTIRNLGRNMAFMIKSIKLGEEKYAVPELELNNKTSFSDGLE